MAFRIENRRLVKYSGKDKKVVIPDGVDTIGKEAFRKCTNLESVTVPDGVKYIRDGAFDGCTGLVHVTIPDSVTTLEWGVFAGCTGLTSVTIGSGVTKLGDGMLYLSRGVFENCKNLTSVSIRNGAANIGCRAFCNCEKLKTITIPDSVTRIEQEAFKGCTGLTDIVIPNSVSELEYRAFKGCTSLTNIVIPDSVTCIQEEVFYGCTSLTNLEIPNTVTCIRKNAFTDSGLYHDAKNWNGDVLYIGQHLICAKESVSGACMIAGGTRVICENAFSKCSHLTKVTIPDSVETIGKEAFSSCTSLSGVRLPNRLAQLNSGSFFNCTNLTSVTIPDTVTHIGSYVFSRTAYSADENNWEDDVLYIGRHLIEAKETLSGRYHIAEGTKCIADGAFDNCRRLSSVIIPEDLTSISEKMFSKCSQLKSVTIPDSVTSICGSAFEYCSSLMNVTIPHGVTSIGSRAFSDCHSLSGLTIPDSVQQIGEWAFSGCKEIRNLTLGNGVKQIGESAFYDCKKLSSVRYTGTTDEWCKIQFGRGWAQDNPVYTAHNLIIGGDPVTDVVIPDGITEIGNSFCGCNTLTSVTIPVSVKQINEWAFYTCYHLKNIYYQGSLEQWCQLSPELHSVSDFNLYLNGDLLTEASIPNGETKIRDYAFRGCSSLTSVTIPDSVTEIGQYAFDECTAMQSLTIGNGVTSIGDWAFHNCKNLTSVTIPSGVKSIGSHAFDIHRENEIYMQAQNPVIANDAFYRGVKKIELPKDFFCKTEKMDADTVRYLLTFHKVLQPAVNMRDYAALLLFQTDKKLLETVQAAAKNQSDNVVQEMIKLMEEKGKAKYCRKAVEFCLENYNTIMPETIDALHKVLLNANATEAIKLLASYMPTKQTPVTSKKAEPETASQPIDVSDSVEDYCNNHFNRFTLEQQAKKMKLAPGLFRKVQLKSSGKTASAFVVQCALMPYIMQYTPPKHISGYNTDILKYTLCRDADIVAAALDPDSLRASMDGLISDSVPGNLSLLIPFGRFASGEQIKRLHAKLKKWSNWDENGTIGRKAVFVARSAILLNSSREAKQIVLNMKKAKNTGLGAEVAPAVIAARIFGISVAEYSSSECSDYGLDTDGAKRYDIGGNTIEARWTDNLTWELFDTAQQKVVRSFPKKSTDPDKVEACAADFAEMKKKSAEEVKQQAATLCEMHMNGSTLSLPGWKKKYVDNALFRPLVQSLVWFDKIKYFTLENGAIIDVEAKPYVPQGSIMLAHVLEMPENEITAWRDYLVKNHRSQLFDQMWEPVVHVNVKDPAFTTRYEGLYISDKQRNALKSALKKRGVTVSSEGTTEYNYHKGKYESYNTTLVFGNALRVKYDFDEDEKVLRFTQASVGYGGKRILNASLYELDKAVLSARVMRDEVQALTDQALAPFTAAQITELVTLATEKNAVQCTATLMDYKNRHFADYGAFDAFTLDW